MLIVIVAVEEFERIARYKRATYDFIVNREDRLE